MKVSKFTMILQLQNAHTGLGGRDKISGMGGFRCLLFLVFSSFLNHDDQKYPVAVFQN